MHAEMRTLVCLTVTDILSARGMTRIWFSHDTTLTVSWPHRFERLGRGGDLSSLIGQRLVSLSSCPGLIVLAFSGGAQLRVAVDGEEQAAARGGPGFSVTTRQGRSIDWQVAATAA